MSEERYEVVSSVAGLLTRLTRSCSRKPKATRRWLLTLMHMGASPSLGPCSRQEREWDPHCLHAKYSYAKKMNQQEFAALLEVMSAPRLSPYRDFFKPATDQQLVGYYLWAQSLSAAVHPLIGLTEIVLRNAIHSSLSNACSGNTSASYPWYDKSVHDGLSLRGKSLEKVEELLYHDPKGPNRMRLLQQPSPDKVISELTFGFWPNIMESLNQKYAPRAFTEVFQHHPQSKPKHWSFPANREPVVLQMKRIQSLRNRVCHFEALWKPHWLNHPSPNWSHAVQGLRILHSDVLALLGWSSPHACALYKASFAWDWFNKICTTKAVRSFSSDYKASGMLVAFEDPVAL